MDITQSSSKNLWPCYCNKFEFTKRAYKMRVCLSETDKKSWTQIWEVIREGKCVQNRRNNIHKICTRQKARVMRIKKILLQCEVVNIKYLSFLQKSIEPIKRGRSSKQMRAAQMLGMLLSVEYPSQGNRWIGGKPSSLFPPSKGKMLPGRG